MARLSKSQYPPCRLHYCPYRFWDWFARSPHHETNMPPITAERRDKLLQQQAEMLAEEARSCPFDDVILSRAWRRADDLDLEDAIELRRELLETERLIALGRSTSRTSVVTTDELLDTQGFTSQRLRQLDDDGLLAVKWDNTETRRKGYILRAELDALPERLRAHADEETRQRRLRKDYVAGRVSAPFNDGPGDLPECLR